MCRLQSTSQSMGSALCGLCTLSSAFCCAECHQNPTSATLLGTKPFVVSMKTTGLITKEPLWSTKATQSLNISTTEFV
jgi:hypothetical protein